MQISGAGRGSRTLVSSLGRIHNSHYTIPADKYIIAQDGWLRRKAARFTSVSSDDF